MPNQTYYGIVDEPHIINSIVWVGSSLKDLRSFPAEVKDVIGFALYQAQVGRKAPSAKPLAGFGGASVIEIVDDYQSDTYRAVYTVRFSGVVYVPRISEEVEERHRDAQTGHGAYSETLKGCARRLSRASARRHK